MAYRDTAYLKIFVTLYNLAKQWDILTNRKYIKCISKYFFSPYKQPRILSLDLAY